MIKRIHIDQFAIKANAKCGFDPDQLKPPISILAGGKTHKAFTVEISGPSRVVYDGRQLGCGARMWIETHCQITADGKEIL